VVLSFELARDLETLLGFELLPVVALELLPVVVLGL
jgi:hypothetical protein